MTTQLLDQPTKTVAVVHRITKDNKPKFTPGCWLWSPLDNPFDRGWQRVSSKLQYFLTFGFHFTHWSPDAPTAPAINPERPADHPYHD